MHWYHLVQMKETTEQTESASVLQKTWKEGRGEGESNGWPFPLDLLQVNTQLTAATNIDTYPDVSVVFAGKRCVRWLVRCKGRRKRAKRNRGKKKEERGEQKAREDETRDVAHYFVSSSLSLDACTVPASVTVLFTWLFLSLVHPIAKWQTYFSCQTFVTSV